MTLAAFGPGEAVLLTTTNATVTVPLAIITTTVAGSAVGQITIPALVFGPHAIHARGARSGKSATAPFLMGAAISLRPRAVLPGALVRLQGAGFAAGETVVASWGSKRGLVLGRRARRRLAAGFQGRTP